eukprot:symbB.v1.2.013133.t1/scaffold916.1/size152367/9
MAVAVAAALWSAGSLSAVAIGSEDTEFMIGMDDEVNIRRLQDTQDLPLIDALWAAVTPAEPAVRNGSFLSISAIISAIMACDVQTSSSLAAMGIVEEARDFVQAQMQSRVALLRAKTRRLQKLADDLPETSVTPPEQSSVQFIDLPTRLEENWARITADHVDLMRWHQGAHRPNLRSVFDVALERAQQALQNVLQNVGADIEPNAEVLRAMEDAGIMEADVEVNQEIAQAFDPDAYHGQPHQQPPLGGYNTPQSVSTQQVLEGEEPEAFVLDYSESDTEKQDKTVFEEPNIIEPLLSLDSRRIEFEWVEKKFEYPIIVRVPLKQKDIEFMAIIATSTSLGDLLNELGNMTGSEIPKDRIAGYVVGNGSRVMMYESISNYCNRNGTLILRPPMSGGVLQRWKSKPMKKDDALMALVARSKERIVSKIDTTLVQETSVPIPVIFASSINQIDGKIATYRQRMVAGELKMEAVLASLPDEYCKVCI